MDITRYQPLLALFPPVFNFVETVIGSGRGSAKFSLAFSIILAAVKAMADAGKVPESDAHELGKLTDLTQEQFDKTKSGGKLESAPQTATDREIIKRSQQSGRGNVDDPQKRPEVTQIYDKFAAPPRTTPPPPLEEERGVVFYPPDKDAPLHEQTPTPGRGREFVTPDPRTSTSDPLVVAERNEALREAGKKGEVGPEIKVDTPAGETLPGELPDRRGPVDQMKPAVSKEQAATGFNDKNAVAEPQLPPERPPVENKPPDAGPPKDNPEQREKERAEDAQRRQNEAIEHQHGVDEGKPDMTSGAAVWGTGGKPKDPKDPKDPKTPPETPSTGNPKDDPNKMGDLW